MAYTDKTVDAWTHSPATGATVPAGTTSPKVGWNGNLQQITEWWTWIRGAFHATTGHTHTGAQGDGTPIAIGGIADGAAAVSNARATAIDYHWCGETIDAFYPTVTGDGTYGVMQISGGYVYVHVTTTNPSSAQLYRQFTNPASATGWTWAKNRTFTAGVYFASVLSTNAKVGCGIDTGNCVQFKLTGGNLTGYVYDGTTVSTVTLITGLTIGRKTLRFEYVAGSKVDFYVDDVLKGTISANLPTGTSLAHIPVLLYVDNNSTTNGAEFRIGEVRCVQHP